MAKFSTSSRRVHLEGLGALVGSVSLGRNTQATEAAGSAERTWVAESPRGFQPLMLPGVVAQAEAKGDFASMMQPNQLWPRPEIARRLLEQAMTDLTLAPNLVSALKKVIHPLDRVAIKVNGIAGQMGHTMAVNFELIEPLVLGLIELGVPPTNITVYEQYPTYLMGTRVNVRKWQLPPLVRAETHNNRDAAMPRVRVFERVPTAFCRQLTDATALINITMMKDHSLCGFTGALKNVTHGSIMNPEDHHANHASPQIARLFEHPIVQSRVRLHITDAFKITYDKGPLDKDPRTRVPQGSVFAATDALALDRVGWAVIDEARKAHRLPTLASSGRTPDYLLRAADLGLGVLDMNLLRWKKSVI
jgi:uncharacterized protein (DUF362 family)